MTLILLGLSMNHPGLGLLASLDGEILTFTYAPNSTRGATLRWVHNERA